MYIVLLIRVLRCTCNSVLWLQSLLIQTTNKLQPAPKRQKTEDFNQKKKQNCTISAKTTCQCAWPKIRGLEPSILHSSRTNKKVTNQTAELNKSRNISSVRCSPRNLYVNSISQISLLVAFLSWRRYLGTEGGDNDNPGVLLPRRVSPNSGSCVSSGTSCSSTFSATTLFLGLDVLNLIGSGSGNTR